jgi:hypothetical protein
LIAPEIRDARTEKPCLSAPPVPPARARAWAHACEPAWRTAAVAPVGLGLRAAQRSGPRAPGENLSNHDDIMRLRISAPPHAPAVLASPAPPEGNHLLDNPARPGDSAAAPTARPTEQRPRAPAGTRAARCVTELNEALSQNCSHFHPPSSI